ncbi:unnamed protein product [Schistocephalus solidus]|uniref:Uncharacterized protein n=1 Tax=Schistocephalus solidus TaxID=70667 RepID=A0A183SNB9_SCHSO|nr:unnamed protein product [Schistocephalus solidus]
MSPRVTVSLLLSLLLDACCVKISPTGSSPAGTVVNGIGPYDELTTEEYKTVVERICKHLGLEHIGLGMLGYPHENNTRDSETWDDLRRPSLIRTALELPPKTQRRTFKERVARVSVHRPDYGLVDEYLVTLGPEMAVAGSVRWVRRLPQHKRPLSLLEVEALDDFVARHIASLQLMIKYLYETAFYRATPSRGEGRISGAQNICTLRFQAIEESVGGTEDPLSQPFCLFAMPTSPLRTARDTVLRSVILRFNRLVVPFNQHPTDIQMQVGPFAMCNIYD